MTQDAWRFCADNKRQHDMLHEPRLGPLIGGQGYGDQI